MRVLKYQRFRNRVTGIMPEPIFFMPLSYPNDTSGIYRSKPFTDSWHLKYNPTQFKHLEGMPQASYYNCYTAAKCTEATDEERAEYIELLSKRQMVIK